MNLHKAGQISVLITSVAVALFAFAESKEKAGAPKHREKTTLQNFPMQAIDGEDLSATTIEGLAPTAAGGPQYDADSPERIEGYRYEVIDQQTDLGRHQIPTLQIYNAPKSVPGMEHIQTYSIENYQR